jgi:hypothetical protein
MNAFDKLLTWASERGNGSWTDWVDACTYLKVETGEYVEPTQAARRLSALGHIEFNWVQNRFAGSPPTAILIPRSSGSIVVTGARPRGMRERLEQISADGDLNVWLQTPISQQTGPETWMVEAEMEDMVAFCEDVGLGFEVDSGRRIAVDLFPTVTIEDAADRRPSGPDDRYPRSWFDPIKLDFRPTGGQPNDQGLWHVHERRRDEAFIRRDNNWYHVPVREYAPFLAYPESVFLKYNRRTQELVVPNRVPLPPLLARAATLQSGRLPLPGPTHFSYVNIDEELATAISGRLRTRVEVMHS